jgi:hypothetical protein
MWPPRFDLSQIQFPKQLKILSILKAQETPQSANNPNSSNPLKCFLNHLQPLRSDSMFKLSLSFSNFPNPTPQKAQTLQKMCQKDQPSKLQKPKSKSQATQSANNPSSTNPLKLSLNDLQPLQSEVLKLRLSFSNLPNPIPKAAQNSYKMCPNRLLNL